MMPTIAFSSFVRRQTKASCFSHFEISDEEVLRRVQEGFAQAEPGYRDGVVLVPVAPNGFFTSTVFLREGDKLTGTFEARAIGERPRKQTSVIGAVKAPAQMVRIVLYRADVLAEGNERSTDAEWEIISINASPLSVSEPMDVATLLYNHFHEPGSNDGGTATGLSDAEFIARLRESFLYWRDKARCPRWAVPAR